MTVYANIKTQYVTLVPVDSASVPAGCLYLDSNNSNQPSVKGTDSQSSTIQTSSGSGTSFFTKKMVASGPIAVRRPVGKRAVDGKIVDGDSDGTIAQRNLIGFTLEPAVQDGDLVNVLLFGPNLAGALTELGFTTGDEIFLSETGGYINDVSLLTGNNDDIIRLGIADCADGTASSSATDLIGFTAVISRI